MSLILPSFKDRRCLELGFCSYVREDDAESLAKPTVDIDEPIYARYESEGHECFLILVPPFLDQDRHVHLQLIAGEKQDEHKPDPDLIRILDLLKPVESRRLVANLRGMFLVKKEDVPSYIRSAELQSFSDKVSVRLIGGKIAVSGAAPLHTLSWELSPKGNAKIYLEMKLETQLQNDCLDKGLDVLEGLFKAFVAKESVNV